MAANDRYDLLVIGAGPGGYIAAIRAAQLGMAVAVVDEHGRRGGTCLRVGCIPSKALLDSTERYAEIKDSLSNHGIRVQRMKVDVARMMKRKDDVVRTLTGGVDKLFKKNGITALTGRAELVGNGAVTVTAAGNAKTVQAARILLATGSRPARLRGIEHDDDVIGDSTTALSWNEIPARLAVIGAGYIGLELGSVWRRLGAKVTVLETLDRILPGLDAEIARLAKRAFERQGIEFRLGTWVQGAEVRKREAFVSIKDGEPLRADRVLVATGRVPNTGDLGLDTAGVELDERGFIVVDDTFRTSADGIYAVGDCIGGAMLAHKASDEGIACVEQMAGGSGHVDPLLVPAVVYTHPEIASVGRTEEQLKEAGIRYRRGAAPYGANGRAHSLGDIDGKVKMLADAATDRVLGVHVIGARAGDLIAQAATAMSFGASSEDIARVVHAHPTLAEVVHEAALAVDRRALHS